MKTILMLSDSDSKYEYYEFEINGKSMVAGNFCQNACVFDCERRQIWLIIMERGQVKLGSSMINENDWLLLYDNLL